MADTTNDNSERDEEIAAIAKTLESRKADLPYTTAYGIEQASRELRALYHRQRKETGKDPDVHRLIRLAEAHLKDEAERLSKAKPKPADGKPEASKPKSRTAPKKPLDPEQHRKAIAKKFAEANWEQQRRKQSEAKSTKNETPEARRNRIARMVLKYRETKKAG